MTPHHQQQVSCWGKALNQVVTPGGLRSSAQSPSGNKSLLSYGTLATTTLTDNGQKHSGILQV